MMPRLIVALFFISFFSCLSEEKEKVPEGILTHEKMVNVMVDVHILEASLGLNAIQMNDTAHKDTIMFYNIFTNNETTKQQYEESLGYYMNKATELNIIYDSVISKLDKKRELLKKK